MKKYTIIITIIATMLMPSCRKVSPDVMNPNHSTYYFRDWSDVFEVYWDGMNYSYSFWDVDPTDWDQVYMDYKPQFEGLEFNDSEDSLKVADLFEKITANLIDHHYSLTLKNPDGSAFRVFSPGFQEATKRDYAHEWYSDSLLLNIVEKNVQTGRFTELTGGVHDGFLIYTCLIEGGIVYFHMNGCNITGTIDLSEEVENTINAYHCLLAQTSDLKGVIIDTRNNPGGYLFDSQFFLRPLISEPVHFADGRTKIGLGRYDYTPWSPYIMEPFEEDEDPVNRDFSDIPIVGLANLFSISMGEMTQMFIKALPNGTVIGERTFGGHGPLNNNFEDSYAGTFDNSAFQSYTSTSCTRLLDGKCYEGIGIIPDIEVLTDMEALRNGVDVQLERAVEFIKTGK